MDLPDTNEHRYNDDQKHDPAHYYRNDDGYWKKYSNHWIIDLIIMVREILWNY